LTVIDIPKPIDVPLRTDPDGVIRVGASRVTLHTLISFYRAGESPETLQEGFPTLSLAEIYATIAYYLANRDTVDAYLHELDREADRVRQEHEAQNPPQVTREALLARLEEERRQDND
jgi:uncharacterized protein (DUF433 family)